jgi:signal transduction histidine kinase
VGIPEEKREEVFAIFRRLHPHGGYGEGTGSGLTIVKRLVERHNGTIWVEPSSSGGTVFCFTLGGKDQHGAQ